MASNSTSRLSQLLSRQGLLDFGVFSTLFLNAIVLTKTPIEFYLPYLFIVIFLPVFMIRFTFPSQLFYILAPLLVTGIFGVYGGNNTVALFFKIFLNVTVSGMFFYYICALYNYDIEYLWRLYLRGAVFTAVIALIQFLAFQVGFTPGYNLGWIFNKWSLTLRGESSIRLNSLFSEPSYFGASMAPAFFVALYSLVWRVERYLKPWQSVLIIATYYLTYSSVGIVGIFVALILLLVNYGLVRYFFIAAPVLIVFFILIYNNVEEFRERLDGIVMIYDGDFKSANDVHGSSFVQYNNLHIAKENFVRNPLFGTGLGSHALAYDKYTLTGRLGGVFDFNKTDANSMALRLMSETGLFGLIFILIFMRRFLVLREKDNRNEVHWLISASILCVIILQLFRQGNYTYNGFFLFLWMYYFNYKNYGKLKEAEPEPSIEVAEEPPLAQLESKA